MLQTASNRVANDPAALESTVAHLQSEVLELQRTLRARSAELAGADAHITRLEEKILKLKEAQKELKRLKREQQALRKSAEGKLGRVLLAPFRFLQQLVSTRNAERPRTDYEIWLDRHRASPADQDRMRDESRAFAVKPLISVITPVFNPPVEWLREAVESVLAQVYENWELLLVDDASTAGSTIEFLAGIEKRDPRIRVLRRETNGGISAASNEGLAQARGEWIGLLDHDDVLEPDALFQTAKLLQAKSDVDLIYSDEDKLTAEGFASPMLKPGWSPDFFLSYNYVCHFTTFRRGLAQSVGGFRPEFDGSQDYDLFLRMIEKTNRIHHVPRVLYHWRRTNQSVADNIRRKPGALEAGRRAIADHLQRIGQRAHVTVDWRTHAYQVRRDLETPQKVSIITAAQTFLSKIDYPSFEIVDLPNDSNVARNLAAKNAEGPWILFLGEAVEPIEGDWLSVMAEHVQRPEVGAVGGRLVSRDGKVQHAGVVIGVEGIAQLAFHGFGADDAGVCRQLQITRNYSAVSSGCLLTRREVFLEVGGFDEQLPDRLADVDLCLKMRQAGYLVVSTPFAQLHGPALQGDDKIDNRSAEIMRERWGEVLKNDPHYNPNLSRARADFSLGN